MKEQCFGCRGGYALKPKHVKEERKEISILACSMSQSLDDS